MKRIALILMFASISIVMFANKSAPTHTEKGVKARGQPTIELNYNVYAVPEFVGSAEVSIVETYSTGSILSPVIVTRNPVEYVKGIVTGTRKIRDVDSCNGNLYTYSNDKRNAIKIKTPRLARGFGSLRILFIYLA